MKIEDEGDFDRPAFVSSKKLGVLEQQLYGHVRAAVDLEALFQLEQHISLILMKDFAMDTALACDLSTQILEAALRRVVDDPARHMTIGGPPDGITEEEKEAVAYDEACEFCLAARQARERAKARGADEADEYCACCEMLRDDWREKHADVLAKAGLARPSSASVSASAIAGAMEIAKRDRARRDKPS